MLVADPNERSNRDALLDNVETTTTAPAAETTTPSSGASSPEEDRISRLRRRREERRRMREQALSGTAGAQPYSSENGPLSFSNSAAAAAAAWETSEWGPGESISPDTDEYGWAEESWSANGTTNTDTYRGGRNPSPSSSTNSGKGGVDGASDDAAWNEEVRQKRERKRRSGGINASTSTSSLYQDDDYLDEENGGEREEDRGYSDSSRAREYIPGSVEPDIALLSPQELERVLPVVPFSAQATYFNGGAAQAVQRWAASLALTVLLSKVAVLAASTLTWPLWWPWAQAASKNYSLRKQSGYAGLWRTQIVEVEARGRPRPQFFGGGSGSGRDSDDTRRSSGSRFSTMRTTRIVLGDPEGAQTEFVLPQDARYDLIQPGQPAELIVLSESSNFESFKAVKDVYLPDCGIWLSEYPYLDRTEFLELSLEVEREAVMSDRSWNAGGDGNEGDDEQYSYEEEEEMDGGEYYYNYNGRNPPPPPPRY
ncbi:hypothetical protein NADE_000439 [Nannochloris sp. 'desiccata']|nr:hypothetical protein KSW81_004791 [Chlorella desiccata (nom. nud.)]KAH7618244.1 hypothetical protein NADE_000439 [Chlorella desiccata (nom. nud.)]